MKRRVLLVDDDVAVLVTLKAVLELNHFDVETANTASEAREKLESHQYEVVITDVRMESDAAGFEVLRAARAQSYDPATAILTAYPPQDDSWKRELVESVLVKPIGTQQLVQQLEVLIAQHGDTRRRRRGETAP